MKKTIIAIALFGGLLGGFTSCTKTKNLDINRAFNIDPLTTETIIIDTSVYFAGGGDSNATPNNVKFFLLTHPTPMTDSFTRVNTNWIHLTGSLYRTDLPAIGTSIDNYYWGINDGAYMGNADYCYRLAPSQYCEIYKGDTTVNFGR